MIQFVLYPENLKLIKYIRKNLNNLEKLDDNIFKIKNEDKIIIFLESWLFHIYEGNTIKDIKFKYDLGGQSNRACYLTDEQKKIGEEIENWYKSQNDIKLHRKLKLNKIYRNV